MLTKGIINSGDMAATGRLDAYYNLAYARHKEALQKLLAAHEHAQLVTMAQSLPVYTPALRLHAGNHTKPVGSEWSKEELGLYLLVCHEEGQFGIAAKEIQDRTDALATATEALQTIISAVHHTRSDDSPNESHH